MQKLILAVVLIFSFSSLSDNSAPIKLKAAAFGSLSQSVSLIGTESSDISQYCSEQNNCYCSFNYSNKQAGSTIDFIYETPAIDYGSNLIRCHVGPFPLANQIVSVKIHLSLSDFYSNGVKVSF